MRPHMLPSSSSINTALSTSIFTWTQSTAALSFYTAVSSTTSAHTTGPLSSSTKHATSEPTALPLPPDGSNLM